MWRGSQKRVLIHTRNFQEQQDRGKTVLSACKKIKMIVVTNGRESLTLFFNPLVVFHKVGLTLA